jgi:hypothetical protein
MQLIDQRPGLVPRYPQIVCVRIKWINFLLTKNAGQISGGPKNRKFLEAES